MEIDRKEKWAWALMFLWAFWLSAEYLVLGKYSYALVYDFGDSFIPLYMGEGARGVTSLFGAWDPRVLGGIDTASHVIGQFRLTKLGIPVMPAWLTFGLFALLQRAIAGIFMYRVVVDVFGGHRGVALAAGALFAVGMGPVGAESYFGYTHNQGLGATALPILVWLHWRLSDHRRLLLMVVMFVAGALVATGTMQVLAIQTLFCFTLVLAAMTPFRQWLRLLPPLIALAVGYTLFELPNVVAIIADWSEVHRSKNPRIPASDRLESSFNSLRNMAFYNAVAIAGITASYIAVGARAVPRGLIAVFAVCLFMLFFDWIVATNFSDPGTLVSFSFVRIVYVMPFLIILAAGIALSRMVTERRGRAIALFLAAGIAVSAITEDAWVKFNNLRYYSHGSNHAVLYDNPAFKKVAAVNDARDPFRLATAYITGITHLNRASFPWAYGLDTADGYVNIYPRRYQELWLEVIRKSDGKTQFDYDKMRDWGNHLYLPAKATDCSSVRLGEFANFNLLSLLNVRFIVSPCPLQDAELKLFAANRKGPGQAWHKLGDMEKFRSIFRGDFPAQEIFIYENPAVLPRYFVAGAVRVFDTGGETVSALGAASPETLRSTVMASKADIEGIDLPRGPAAITGTVRILSVKNDEIRLEVTADRNSVLLASNTYNKRWTAMVNGKPSKIFIADHALQGLVVPKGRSEVVLRYRTAMSELFGRP